MDFKPKAIKGDYTLNVEQEGESIYEIPMKYSLIDCVPGCASNQQRAHRASRLEALDTFDRKMKRRVAIAVLVGQVLRRDPSQQVDQGYF